MKPLNLCTALLGLLLSGCSGGGGGPTPTFTAAPPVPPPAPPPPPPLPTGSPFSSWSSAPSPGTYQLSGGGFTVGKATWSTVSPHLWGSSSSSDQNVVLTFNSAGDLSDSAVIEGQNAIFNTQAPSTAFFERRNKTFGIGSASLAVKQLVRGDEDTDQLRIFAYADPASIGLSYMTFGWWAAGEWGQKNDQYGGFSAGAPTSGAAIPTSGAAQFTGGLAAVGVDTSFTEVAAPVTINVDFGARSAAFSAANFRDNQGTIYAGTALTGVLTYGAQQNALTGQLMSTTFAGPANGRFYGPAAEEIGGAFVLSPTDPNAFGRVIGSFGAKR